MYKYMQIRPTKELWCTYLGTICVTYSHTYSDLIVTALDSILFTRYNIFHINLECIVLLYMNKLLGKNLGFLCRIVLKIDIRQRMYLSTCQISPHSDMRKRRYLVSVGCVHRHCSVKKAWSGWGLDVLGFGCIGGINCNSIVVLQDKKSR